MDYSYGGSIQRRYIRFGMAFMANGHIIRRAEL